MQWPRIVQSCQKAGSSTFSVGAVYVCLLGTIIVASPATATDISRAPENQRQKFEAWGTSLAWWANGVGSWSDGEARSDLVRTMFDQENGLGLNYARYNIGGGQNRQFASNFRPGALVNGWVPSAPSDVSDTSTWNWNWNADATQRRVLDEVLELGVSRVDAISYSAPFWMTNSLDSAGGVNGAANLPSQNVDELAHYQSEVVQHFYENLGVQFQAFSPLNEPNVNWWVAGGRQEGMRVAAGSDQRQILQAVGTEFAARGLPIGLSGVEETNTAKTVEGYLQLDNATKSYLTHLHTHVYGGNSTGNLNQIRAFAESDGLKIYQSEYGNNSNDVLLGGLTLANRITQDINQMGVNGWAYWQVVEPTSLSGAGWGLAWAGYGQADSEYTIRKQFHVMRQFSSYIRPGSQILNTSDDNLVAAYDPVSDTTVLVVNNFDGSPSVQDFTLVDGAPAYARVIRTSVADDFTSQGRFDAGASFSIETPGTSVTTVVLHHRPNLIVNAGVDTSGAISATALSDGWRSSGSATYAPEFGPNDAVLGLVQLPATNNSSNGAVWQEGIGHAGVDRTGEAFQLSLDVQFKSNGVQIYDAETTIGLEFYGADGETLAHTSLDDYATSVTPLTDDTEWRTFRTPAVVAPAGTRYIRPVVRLADAAGSSTVQLDNFYLQETKSVPRGRHWSATGNGSTSELSNWDSDADRGQHDHWYFGSANAQAATVSVTTDETISALTIDSDRTYRVAGAGVLKLIAEENERALVDIRSGSHRIQTAIDIDSDTTVQSVGDAQILISGPVSLNGHTLRTQGAGEVSFSGALSLDGGVLEVYAKPQTNTLIGSNATLDGTLNVLLEPGVLPSLGDTFELVAYSGNAVLFDLIELPALGDGLDWAVEYSESLLSASIVEAILAGDFNNDGVVDAADYSSWRDALGQPAGSLPNDPNDSEIGADQYATWVANFGASNVAAVTVPEPGALTVVVYMLAAAGLRPSGRAVLSS